MISRLTKDEVKECATSVIAFQIGRVCGKTLTKQIMSELLEYKCIEAELGIDLVTLFKALKNGIYIKDGYNSFKDNGDKWFITTIENEVAYYHRQLNIKQFTKRKKDGMVGDDEYCPSEEVDKATGSWNSTYVYLEDYGKTWALTKEEFNEV